MKITLHLFLFIFLTSCSSYIQRMHREMDSDIQKNNDKRQPHDRKFGHLKNPSSLDYTDRDNLNSGSTKDLSPNIKRQYAEAQNKRTKIGDLVDDGDDGSLWSGRGQENFFFSKNNKRKIGDIVTLKVMENLKDEISLELKKTFPSANRKKETPAPAAAGAAAPGAPAAEEKAPADKVFDKISSIVIEEISADHLLLKGRKDILFNKAKHTVEVSVLVPRVEVEDDDTIASTSALETSVAVIR